jgi:SAM-dependent methyltransferase
MQAGHHIPSYLLLERFSNGRNILDVYPPDEQGADLLLPMASAVTLIQASRSEHQAEMKAGLQRIVASGASLPFRQGAFDMVLMLNLACERESFTLENELTRCRNLLSPGGIAALLIPNVEGAHANGLRGRIPDFIDMERLLRRYFPHLTLFAQQPLFGATLSPIGRRVKDDAPLLDDRMLPIEGETPDYFLALGSGKYHRLDDTVIAQLPFLPVAESFQLEAEKYEGALRLVQAEKRARDKKLDILTVQIDELNDKLFQAELEVRDRESLVSKVAYLDEQILRREAAVADAEQKASLKSQHQIELEESVRGMKQEVRRLEHQLADRGQTIELLQKEREEHETERRQLMSDLHGAQSELKTRQRALDERIEEVASREAELALVRTEIVELRESQQKEGEEHQAERRRLLSELHGAQTELKTRQRALDERMEEVALREAELESVRREIVELRELLQKEREERRRLASQVREQENYTAILGSLEKELNKIRMQSQEERERLEQQFDEEHRKLLDEIAVREDMRRKAHLLEVQVKELELAIETDKSRTDAQTEDIQTLMIRLEMLQNEKKELLREKRDADIETEELEQNLQITRDDLERTRHLVQIVTTRAEEAEERSRVLQQRLSEAQSRLSDLEQRCGELQLQSDRYSLLEEKHNESLLKVSELEESLAVADGRSRAAVAHRNEHVAELEERYTEAMNQVRELKKAYQKQEALVIEAEVDALRLSQLEERHRVALAQVESLQQQVEEFRPVINSAATLRQQAETAEIKYLEEQTAHQKTRAMLVDMRGKLSRLDQALSMEQEAHQRTSEESRAVAERIGLLEADLNRAMGALAEREEGSEQKLNTAGEKVRHLRNELIRLQHENETELLCVREDLETELRHSSRRLEQAQQEIWELREEVIRMKAQSAATAAAAAKKGINEEFQKTLIEQEILIETVNSERDMLRNENERLKKSLLNRKKNIRILATLLRREHYEHTFSSSGTKPLMMTDIKRLIESEGGELTDELDFLNEAAPASAARSRSSIPDMAFSDDEVVDAIMESVVVTNGSIALENESSTHIQMNSLSLETAANRLRENGERDSNEPEVIDNRPSYDPDVIHNLRTSLIEEIEQTSDEPKKK